jgi:hypothetical protein
LRQVIQVDFVRQVDNIIHGSLGRWLVIFFFLKVINLVGQLLLELLQNVQWLQVPLVWLPLQLSQRVV